MQATTQYDLLTDLADLLRSYLKHLPIEFSLGGEALWLSEVFSKSGTLLLFILDKQPVIDQYIEDLNQRRNPTQTKYFARLEYYEDNKTLLSILPSLSHNLVDNYCDSIDINPYYDFLKFLGHAVLVSPIFNPTDNNIVLDALYDKMYEAVKNTNIDIMPSKKMLAWVSE